jgi:hypothetical protein
MATLMTRPASARTLAALALIGKPRAGGGVWSAYAAAREAGISLTTMYKHVRRERERTASPPAPPIEREE